MAQRSGAGARRRTFVRTACAYGTVGSRSLCTAKYAGIRGGLLSSSVSRRSEIPPLWLIATDTADGKPSLPLEPCAPPQSQHAADARAEKHTPLASSSHSAAACATVMPPADVPDIPMFCGSANSSPCFHTT